MYTVTRHSHRFVHQFWTGIYRSVIVMLITFCLICFLDVFMLIPSHQVSPKPSPCFTDGDCQSSLEKCVFGSWKRLGKCQTKLQSVQHMEPRVLQRVKTRAILLGKRRARQKRSSFHVWRGHRPPDLEQRRTQEEINEEQGLILQYLQASANKSPFDRIIADLFTSGWSDISYHGVNITVSLWPLQSSSWDWLMVVAKDNISEIPSLGESGTRARRVLYRLQPSEYVGDKQEEASDEITFLENSFKNSTHDRLSSNNLGSPQPELKRIGSLEEHFRYRRELLMENDVLKSIDPLINGISFVSPVIPEAEDIFVKSLRKRSSTSNEASQRARRELDRIEENAMPLPKIITSNEDGPVVIEDMFASTRDVPAIRRKRHPELASQRGKSRAVKGKRATAKAKRMNHARRSKNVMAVSLLSKFLRKKRNKVKGTYRNAPAKEDQIIKDVALGGIRRKRMHGRRQRTRSAHKRKVAVTKQKIAGTHNLAEAPGASVVHEPSSDAKPVQESRISDAKREADTQVPLSPSLETDPGSPRQKHDNPDVISTTDSGQDGTTMTTQAPDPFTDREKSTEPVDYYDVSKRELDEIEDDFDPEADMKSAIASEDDTSKNEIEGKTPRKKRQSYAEQTEDDNAIEEIPPWRRTIELLKKANTFAIPAHGRNGHIILVRRVRDLGGLDLGESLTKLKETMSKVFGRCYPLKRRKRSHRRSPEVVKDILENQETWEIQGEKDEMVNAAQVDVKMDDDKPYNMTTIIHPMGKRNSKRKYSNTQKKKKDVLKKMPPLNIVHKSAFSENSAKGIRDGNDVEKFEGSLENIRQPKSLLATRQKHKYFASKREDYDIPPNKRVHYKVPSDSNVGLKLSVDHPSPNAKPVISAKLSSDKGAEGPMKRRNKVLRSLQGPKQQAKYPRARCVGCRKPGASIKHMPNKIIREPYIITRRYNDSKIRAVRQKPRVRRARELGEERLETGRLLYAANGDLLPDAKNPANAKRDVDIAAEVKIDDGETTTQMSSITVETIVIKEEEDVFGGDKWEEITDEKVVASSKENVVPLDGSSVVIVDKSPSVITVPVKEEIVKTSMVGDDSNTRKGQVDDLIMPDTDLDRSLSTSTDHLMSLISEVEKALRVPLGNARDVTVIEESSVPDGGSPVVITSGGPATRLNELKLDLTAGTRPLEASASIEVDNPPVQQRNPTVITQSDGVPLRVPMQKTVNIWPTVLNPYPRVQTIQYAFPEKKTVGEVRENIYLKGFDPLTRPLKPMFVESAANKMAWVPPSYKTVVATASDPVVKPGYVRIYGNGNSLPGTSIAAEIDTNVGGVKKETFEKIQQPAAGKIYVVPAGSIKSPKVFDLHGNLAVNGQLMGDAAPSLDTDTFVKVVSSVHSGNSEGSPMKSFPPPVIVETSDDSAPLVGKFPSGHIIATVGDGTGIIKKKDVSDTDHQSSQQPLFAAEQSDSAISKDKKSEEDNETKRSPSSSSYSGKLSHHPQLPNSYKRMADGSGSSIALPSDKSSIPRQNVYTYTSDPGVKGATMNMLNDLATKLTMQNSQGNDPPTVQQRSIACLRSQTGGCMRKYAYPTITNRGQMDPRKAPSHTLSKREYPSGSSEFSAALDSLKVKRDVSPSIFEKKKQYFSNPTSIYEEPVSRSYINKGRSREQRSYSLGNDKRNAQDIYFTGIMFSNTTSANTSRPERPNEPKSNTNRSNIGAEHDQAVKEATGQERFNILDSQEMFSSDLSTFDKRLYGGGYVIEEQKIPIFPNVNNIADRNTPPSDPDSITIHKNMKQQTHDFRQEMTGFDVSFFGETNPSSPTIPVPEAEGTVISRTIRSVDHMSTRIKRKPTDVDAAKHKTGGNKKASLRRELRNLNKIGKKMGVKLFDKSSISQIVENETKRDTRRKTKRAPGYPKKKAMVKWEKRMQERRRKRKEFLRNLRKSREKEATDAAREKVADILKTEGAMDSKTIANAMGSAANTKSKRGLDEDSKKVMRGGKRKGIRKLSKAKRSSKRPKHQRRVVRKADRNKEAQSNLGFQVQNKVRNDRLVEVANPEHYYLSNGRSREEKLVVDSNMEEPMEVNAVLRGKRKKRAIAESGTAFSQGHEGIMKSLPPFLQPIPEAEPIYAQAVNGIPHVFHEFQPKQDFARSVPAFSFNGNHIMGASTQISSEDPNRASKYAIQRNSIKRTPETHAEGRFADEVVKRQQIFNAFGPRRNTYPASNLMRQASAVRGLEKTPKAVAERDTNFSQPHIPTVNRLMGKVGKPAPNSPQIQHKPSQLETTPNPKSSGESVWKRLGEIFDINRKETVDKHAITTAGPFSSSPIPLQQMTQDDVQIHLENKNDKDINHIKQNSNEKDERGEMKELQNKSGLRAAIVDRLLHDLRKMSYAKGSEMARAESDLIEILHDYQTDLMDEDEETIAGQPFQGVRIHDNVAIPVVYQAVPIKLEGLARHRIVVRDNVPKSARHHSRHLDEFAFIPP